MKAAIIGLGVVGSAQMRMFERRYAVVTYDPKFDSAYPRTEIAGCDFAVISVNTPASPDGSCNLDYVRQAFEDLPPSIPVILRSTVPVGTTQALSQLRSGHVVHVPEFMHESAAGAWHESYDVPFMMIGGSPYAREWAKPVMASVTDAEICEGRSEETELAKLVTNSYWAVKVAFVNHIADICEEYGIQYDAVRALWLSHPQADPAYTRMSGFGRGFGGACLPKDLADLAGHLPKPNLFSVVSRWNNRGAALPMD